MNYWINLSIIVAIIAFIVLILGIFIFQQSKKVVIKEKTDSSVYHMENLLSFIKKRMNEIVNRNLYTDSLSEEEFKRRTRRRKELKDALKNCNTGDLSSKIYVREYILELLLSEYGLNEQNVDYTVPFHQPDTMSAHEKFETILYLVSKKYGNQAFAFLCETFNLNKPKENGSYYVTEEEINNMYRQITRGKGLTFEDKMRIVTQILYSKYKGFGVIDEVRDQSVDGISGGVSGLPKRISSSFSEKEIVEAAANNNKDLNSVWVIFKGVSIHLSFLSFEHEAELRRVVTNLYKYGTPGQLSETKPAIISELSDGSRITVVRPKLAESWAFFIRKKFDSKLLSLEQIITHKNSKLPIRLLQFLMKGHRTCAITGAQGSGKTTLLMALIAFIHPALKLRIQETSFELNLRNLYPNRNILSFQETDTMSGQDGLDLQKKTDGDVTILGEVATDPVAAWAIQSAQVASLFTIFTHHAKTFANLVFSLRNSLLKVGMFSNESIAEQQVVSVLEFDIHLQATITGERYIERVTECIPVQYEDESSFMEKVENASSYNEKVAALVDIASTYFRQQTQRKHFIERNIIEYRNGEYVAVHPISKERQEEILTRLTVEEQELFKEFILTHWGN